jgi:fatty-acyl-CoA synthase
MSGYKKMQTEQDVAVGTLLDTAKWWAANRTDVPAIVTPGDQVTFAELDSWGEAIAEWLVAQGLQMGDRVSIFAVNSLEWCILSQGILRAGGLLAPVNPRYTLSEATYMVGKLQSKFIFCDPEREPVAQEIARVHPFTQIRRVGEITALRHRKTEAISARQAITPDTPIVIISTSGSTARPKGVVYSHRTMMSYILEFSLAEPRAVDHARLLLFAPLSTSAGFVLLTQFLAYGGTLYVDETFDPARALKRVKEDKITALMGAPVFFERIAACDGFEAADLSNVRLTSVGGARVSRQLLETYMKKGALLRQIYGQTEAGGQCTINTPEASVTHPEKCGRGMPFTRVATMDPAGNICPPGQPGEIVIQGPSIMVGYWDDPEETAKALLNGWLHSGDLGVIDADGLLTMLDRLKDIIISGGLNISAAEVERVVSEFPGIEEVAAIAAKDARFGETTLAVIYTRGAVDVAQLIAHCNLHLSDFKVPRYVVVEKDPLPRLATGKIAKPALRTKYVDAHLTLTKVR